MHIQTFLSVLGNCTFVLIHGTIFLFQDSVYDALFNNNVAPKVEKKASFGSSHNSKKASFESPHSTKKASSKPKNTNDFDYLFGMGGNSILKHCQLVYIWARGDDFNPVTYTWVDLLYVLL